MNLGELKGFDLFDYATQLQYLKDGEVLPFIVSTVFLTYKVIWLMPNGEPFTQLEKMFMMFDDDVWIGVGCTLLVLLIAIRVINRLSLKIQNFVFGRGVRTPTMNLLEIFLCGAQYKVPGRNFARFLLILFVFWSLVIRTCYQSKLFEFLQSDLRKPRIESLSDVAKHNFTILEAPR